MPPAESQTSISAQTGSLITKRFEGFLNARARSQRTTIQMGFRSDESLLLDGRTLQIVKPRRESLLSEAPCTCLTYRALSVAFYHLRRAKSSGKMPFFEREQLLRLIFSPGPPSRMKRGQKPAVTVGDDRHLHPVAPGRGGASRAASAGQAAVSCSWFWRSFSACGPTDNGSAAVAAGATRVYAMTHKGSKPGNYEGDSMTTIRDFSLCSQRLW